MTGGAGLIGSAVIWELNRRGFENILVSDHLRSSENGGTSAPFDSAITSKATGCSIGRLNSRRWDHFSSRRLFLNNRNGCGIPGSQ